MNAGHSGLFALASAGHLTPVLSQDASTLRHDEVCGSVSSIIANAVVVGVIPSCENQAC